MGANGMLRIWTLWTMTSSANSKTMKTHFGGVGGPAYMNLSGFASTSAFQGVTMIRNRNSQSSQIGYTPGASSGLSSNASSNLTSSQDTSTSQDIVITGQKASSGETLTLEAYTVELYYKA